MISGIDEYGCIENNLDGAKLVAEQLLNSGAVTFSWSHNKTDAYIFIITKQFSKIGVMPFGGNPVGRLYVGLYGKGCNHFSTESIDAGYWYEKLNIDHHGAQEWSKFWNMIHVVNN